MTYDEFLEQWRSEEGFIIAHTSGSTGTPKEIRLPKGMMRRSAERTIAYFGISPQSRLHSCIAADFIGGKMMAVRAEVSGAAFSSETPSNRPLGGFSAADRLDLVSVVPSQMRHVIDRYDEMPRVGAFLIGGSAIHPELRQAIVDRGVTAYESYGMTETASHIALRPVDAGDAPFSLLPGVSVSADDDGCLVIDLGEDGIVRTNDMVRFCDPERRTFRIVGRRDHVIVTGGKKVNPMEVEAAVAGLFPGVDICVTSRPDPLWTSRVVLLAECPDCALDRPSLTERMRELLPPWAVPKEIIAVERLPRTASGKIKRQLGGID